MFSRADIFRSPYAVGMAIIRLTSFSVHSDEQPPRQIVNKTTSMRSFLVLFWVCSRGVTMQGQRLDNAGLVMASGQGGLILRGLTWPCEPYAHDKRAVSSLTA